MKSIFLIFSLLANIGLLIFCFYIKKDPELIPIDGKNPMPDYEITSTDNFKKVFFDRNDSLYKDLWGEAFENEPEKAFLISCAYNYVTQDTSAIHDIKISADQLETMYHKGLLGQR